LAHANEIFSKVSNLKKLKIFTCAYNAIKIKKPAVQTAGCKEGFSGFYFLCFFIIAVV
jgi:hypothetical protein